LLHAICQSVRLARFVNFQPDRDPADHNRKSTFGNFDLQIAQLSADHARRHDAQSGHVWSVN